MCQCTNSLIALKKDLKERNIVLILLHPVRLSFNSFISYITHKEKESYDTVYNLQIFLHER